MKLRITTLYIILLFSSHTLYSKNLITGRVIDAETGEALPRANIFFAGTSLGVSTTDDGNFTLSGFPSGKYDFTVTFVGYAVYQQAIVFSGETRLKFLIKLTPQPEFLKNIVIRPNDRDRKENLRMFEDLLLGRTPQAKQCKIMNLDDIHVYKDSDEGKLIASSSNPIQIENRALGYRMSYYLVLFEYQYRIGKLDSYGIPQFSELEPENEQEKEKWVLERKEVYKGSIAHFLHALVRDSLVEREYEVARILERPNPARPKQQIINEKIEYYKTLLENSTSGTNTSSLQDSLMHYQYVNRMPLTRDSLVKEVLHGHELLDNDSLSWVTFTRSLTVRYNEAESRQYRASIGKYEKYDGQYSMMHIRAPFKVYENGYYDNTGNLLVEGYWAWAEKVSTMLPVDFTLRE